MNLLAGEFTTHDLRMEYNQGAISVVVDLALVGTHNNESLDVFSFAKRCWLIRVADIF